MVNFKVICMLFFYLPQQCVFKQENNSERIVFLEPCIGNLIGNFFFFKNAKIGKKIFFGVFT